MGAHNLGVLRGVPGVWWGCLALIVASAASQPRMMSPAHALDILQVASFLGIASIGQTLVVLTGGLDLSVGAVMTVTNIVVAGVMRGDPDMIVPAVFLCLTVGGVIGTTNGVIVAKLGIPPLIATLAMQAIVFGGALLYTGGIPSGSLPDEFLFVGQGRLAGVVPVSAVLWIGLSAVLIVLTRRSRFGRHLYSTGANSRAASLTGVNVDRTLILTYALSGVLAAVAGLVLTSYIGLPAFGIGERYLLISVAAVVVGGTALTGGIGGIGLTLGGVLFMTLLVSLTNVADVGTGGQLVTQGLLIVAGTALYGLLRRRFTMR